MKNLSVRASALAVAAVAAAAALLAQEVPMARAADLTAGIAVVDITPPPGYRMSGYFSERLSTGTKDPLYAKALVLGQGDVRMALVFCDIIGISPGTSGLVQKVVRRRFGIPSENVLIAATHSHTGPLYWGALRKHFHDRAVAEHGEDPCERVHYDLEEKLVDVIGRAHAAARPASLAAGTAQQHGLSFNRRFHMKDGTVRFNPGPLNPDIVRAAGPIDPQVGIVMVRRPGAEKPEAGIVNFALHPDTVGGTLYSADYPFFAEQTLRETFGKDFLLLFGNGTCGDINHIDVTRKERPRTDVIGQRLAETVCAAALRPVTEPCLAVRREIVHAPIQKVSPEKIAWAHEAIAKIGTADLPFLEQVEAYKILAIEMRQDDHVHLAVHVFRLSKDLALVGLPGEVFVDLGLAIKKASPFPVTLVVELCQDAPGYIPTRKAFAEGSYETVNSRIAPGGGEMMVEAAVRLLAELGGANE